MKEKKIAVHCSTEEEWDAVSGRIEPEVESWSESRHYYTVRDRASILLDSGDYWSEDGCEELGYTIIPASEYLREEEFKVGDRVEVTIHNQLARIGMTGILYRKKGENDEVWNDSTRKWIVTFDDNIGSKNVPGNTPGHDYYMPEENLKQTNKPIKEESNMSEETVTIGSIFLEVFENGKDAKRMSDRFGEQYGENPDRDLIALENDKGKLTRILEDEEGKEEAAAEKAAKGGK